MCLLPAEFQIAETVANPLQNYYESMVLLLITINFFAGAGYSCIIADYQVVLKWDDFNS